MICAIAQCMGLPLFHRRIVLKAHPGPSSFLSPMPFLHVIFHASYFFSPL
jgi:hypothetical protein